MLVLVLIDVLLHAVPALKFQAVLNILLISCGWQ